MTPWEVHPAARDEFDHAMDHFLGIEPELAVAFAAYFRICRRKICENPLLYNIRRFKARRVNLASRFNEYYIAYMIWREKVVILAIGHAKQRPYYWRKRIRESRDLF